MESIMIKKIRFGSFFVELGLGDFVKHASLDKETATTKVDVANEYHNGLCVYAFGSSTPKEAEKDFMDFFNNCNG